MASSTDTATAMQLSGTAMVPTMSFPSSPFVVFLDIDGVLYGSPDQEAVFRKVHEIFPDLEKPYYNRECNVAATYFFNQDALKNLNDLIAYIPRPEVHFF